MRAMEFGQFGGPEVLSPVTVATPVPIGTQALVRVIAAGVNPLDNTVRSGHLPSVHTFPVRPGTFAVGVIDEGADSGWEPGTRVVLSGGRYGISGPGAWAEYVAVDAAHLVAVPEGVSDDDALALTTGTGFSTAYLALTRLAGFRAGQSVLAPGAAGAVGSGGVEVARVLGAAHAITTATDPERARIATEAGFDTVDLSRESLREGIDRLTDGRGVDVVLDGIGGSFTGPALSVLNPDGTLISIGYAAGTGAPIPVTDLIWKNLHVHGFRFARFSAEEVNAVNTLLLRLVADGLLHPTIGARFRLEDAAEAARTLAQDRPFGRVVLQVSDGHRA